MTKKKDTREKEKAKPMEVRTFRLSDETMRELDAIAKAEGLNRSRAVARAIQIAHTARKLGIGSK